MLTLKVPKPNSSMEVFPRMGAPSPLQRSTTVASKGGTYPFSIAEPAVVSSPLVQTLSLTETAYPSSLPEPKGSKSSAILLKAPYLDCISLARPSMSFILSSAP